jgi:uncharacterized protein YdcH (DUF465 family)
MASLSREEVKEQLLASNAEFRQLAHEHQKHEQRLGELLALHFPNMDEQMEEAVLKKKKLMLKDRMEGIIQVYQRQGH